MGNTGAQVSLLAFGGGSRFVSYGEENGIAALNHALDLGITYIDTCDSYGPNGESQLWIGKVLKQRGRKGLWLASKIGPRKYDDFMRMLDVSLKRLQVDQRRPAAHPRADGSRRSGRRLGQGRRV